MILLKNEQDILPLQRSQISRLAVIGAHVDDNQLARISARRDRIELCHGIAGVSTRS